MSEPTKLDASSASEPTLIAYADDSITPDLVSGGALVQLGSPIIDLHGRRIAEVTLKQRLPAISPFRSFAVGGGLMSYGPDQRTFYPRAANYIDGSSRARNRATYLLKSRRNSI